MKTRGAKSVAGMIVAAFAALACAAAAAAELNTASRAELESVKGIGPQLSAAMLAERAKAPFAGWPDAMARLPGLKPKRAAQLSAAGLTVAGQPWQPAEAAVRHRPASSP